AGTTDRIVDSNACHNVKRTTRRRYALNAESAPDQSENASHARPAKAPPINTAIAARANMPARMRRSTVIDVSCQRFRRLFPPHVRPSRLASLAPQDEGGGIRLPAGGGFGVTRKVVHRAHRKEARS